MLEVALCSFSGLGIALSTYPDKNWGAELNDLKGKQQPRNCVLPLPHLRLASS